MTRPRIVRTPCAFSRSAQSSNTPRHAVSRAEAGIARPDDQQITVERAELDRADAEDPGLVGVVPSKACGGRGQRHDFHVRGRHHQLGGVARVERLVGRERLDEHAPVAALERRLREDGVDVVLELDERVGRVRRLGSRRRHRSCGARRRMARREDESGEEQSSGRTCLVGPDAVTWRSRRAFSSPR